MCSEFATGGIRTRLEVILKIIKLAIRNTVPYCTVYEVTDFRLYSAVEPFGTAEKRAGVNVTTFLELNSLHPGFAHMCKIQFLVHRDRR